MRGLSIEYNEDYHEQFQRACYACDLEKIKYFTENRLVSILEGPSIISGCITDEPEFHQMMGYLIEQGLPQDYYLFSLPELMTGIIENLLINGIGMEDGYIAMDTIAALKLGTLVNGMSKGYPNKTAMDIFFEKFSETDPAFQMPIIQKLIGLGARRFSELSHQERVLNSDLVTAMQYPLEDLKHYFADRNAKGWHYPGLRFSGILYKVLKRARQDHLSFEQMLEKMEFVAFQHTVTHVLDILCCFLDISRDDVYCVSASYSPLELAQVLQMLFRHKELSWQFKLSEINNPQFLEEIAGYVCSGNHHEVAEQFLARASLV